jgi:hypothetical protein
MYTCMLDNIFHELPWAQFILLEGVNNLPFNAQKILYDRYLNQLSLLRFNHHQSLENEKQRLLEIERQNKDQEVQWTDYVNKGIEDKWLMKEGFNSLSFTIDDAITQEDGSFFRLEPLI